ncbi:MAG: hypothetical protein M3436_15730 [Pseudomonadota bacterium]|nr:hypothetical protein [Pseudomonadota bacterium]
MTSYKTKFILKNLPMDQGDADRLSNEITLSFGSEGWELVSTAVVTNPAGPAVLLLTLQKEDAG